MTRQISRRTMLQHSGLASGAGLLANGLARPVAAQPVATREPFKYCLNTSTIRGQQLGLDKKIEIVSQAGYQGIEPWMREIREYTQAGGQLADLRKKISDAGLTVESAIGFAPWIVDDEQQRAEALETVRRDMDVLRQIGGQRIAAPPVGATKQPDLDLSQAAQRYGKLLEVGQHMGVVPQLELWGFSQSLSRLGEVAFVAIESGHPQACLLLDVYHIFKGGSDFQGLKLINGSSMHALHINDYPGDLPRDQIGDADRVYPGDGAAPLTDILRDLYESGFRGTLSLELFNREYWKNDALEVARTGLEKMRQAVTRAFA